MALPTPPAIVYDKSKFIETSTGNKVSRTSVLCGSQNIVLVGKTVVEEDCVIRGDLANIRVQRSCVFKSGTVLRPPAKILPNKPLTFLPLSIGENVFVDEGSLIQAASIGSFVCIGKRVVIGEACILKDCCKIEDDCVLPPGTVVPPYTIYGGSPGRQIGMLPECSRDLIREVIRQYYNMFQVRD